MWAIEHHLSTFQWETVRCRDISYVPYATELELMLLTAPGMLVRQICIRRGNWPRFVMIVVACFHVLYNGTLWRSRVIQCHKPTQILFLYWISFHIAIENVPLELIAFPVGDNTSSHGSEASEWSHIYHFGDGFSHGIIHTVKHLFWNELSLSRRSHPSSGIFARRVYRFNRKEELW